MAAIRKKAKNATASTGVRATHRFIGRFATPGVVRP
jgi:hypothetical protein